MIPEGYRCRCLHTVAATLGSVQTLWSYVRARLSKPSLCWDVHTSLVCNAYSVAVRKAGEAAGHRRLWVVRREEEKLLSCDIGDQTGLAFICCAQTTPGYSSGPQSSQLRTGPMVFISQDQW